MFDAVLDRHPRGPKRWGRGAIAAAALHGLAAAGVIAASIHAAKAKKIDAPVVTFFAPPAPPPPPPPPPPAGGGATASHKPKVERKIERKPDTIVQSKKSEPIPDPPKEEAPKKSDAPGQAGGVEGGVVGGVAGGVVGGVVGGTVGGQLGGVLGGTGPTTGVLPFGAGMTRPSPIGGDEIQYTREAREAHVSGLMIVKCVIAPDGSLQSCRIIKGVPLMDQAVLAALARHRGSPVMFQGRPVSVDYTFNIRLSMPD